MTIKITWIKDQKLIEKYNDRVNYRGTYNTWSSVNALQMFSIALQSS